MSTPVSPSPPTTTPIEVNVQEMLQGLSEYNDDVHFNAQDKEKINGDLARMRYHMKLKQMRGARGGGRRAATASGRGKARRKKKVAKRPAHAKKSGATARPPSEPAENKKQVFEFDGDGKEYDKICIELVDDPKEDQPEDQDQKQEGQNETA